MPAFNELGPRAVEDTRRFLAEEKSKLLGEDLLFKKTIPEYRPQRYLLMSTLCHTIQSYLCDYCCSHSFMKFATTMQGSFDIV